MKSKIEAGKFELMDLNQLDYVTYDELAKLLLKYEDVRGIVEHWVEKYGGRDDAKAYDLYDDFLSSVEQTKEIRRRRAILQQIREQYLGGKTK